VGYYCTYFDIEDLRIESIHQALVVEGIRVARTGQLDNQAVVEDSQVEEVQHMVVVEGTLAGVDNLVVEESQVVVVVGIREVEIQVVEVGSPRSGRKVDS
jgi:hypothetical protein